MPIESYATEAGALVAGVAVGIVIRAKLWWGYKSKAEKTELISDAIQSVEDGKITASEAKMLIKKHL